MKSAKNKNKVNIGSTNRANDTNATSGRSTNPSIQSAITSLQQSTGNQNVSTLLGNGRPLPNTIRSDMEARFATQFDDVRIHDSESAHKSAKALSAKAYTFGNSLVFSDGRYAPYSGEGRRLLAHELAHVIQQRRGGATPSLNPSASNERAAESAARSVVSGSGQVSVAGASGVGIARDKEDEEEKEPRKGANTTVLTQTSQKQKKPKLEKTKEPPKPDTVTINEPNKGKGTRAESNVPFELYSGPEWSVFGGGSETASSRTDLSRRSSADKKAGREQGTAGIDFLAFNMKTGELVIGEQKATSSAYFDSDVTATTKNLKANIAQTIKAMRNSLASGKVHPDSRAHVQKILARLEATHAALHNKSKLPKGVAFELTNVEGGQKKGIGKGYIDTLPEDVRNDPERLQDILDRTRVRDPELARRHGKDPQGKNPDIVPISEIMTPGAKDEVARLKSGKTKAQWKKSKAAEKKRAQAKAKKQSEKDKKRAAAEKKKQRNKQATRDKEDSEKVFRDARERALKDQEQKLQEKIKSGEIEEPKSKTAWKKLREKLKFKSNANKEAGKAKKQYLEQLKEQRAQKQAEEKAQRDTEELEKKKKSDAKRQEQQRSKEAAEARKKDTSDFIRDNVDSLPKMTEEQYLQLPKEQRKKLEEKASKNPEVAKALGEKLGKFDTPTHIEERKKQQQRKTEEHNKGVKKRNAKARREAVKGKAAQRANQAAAGLRAADAYQNALDKGEGQLGALYEGGKTYLENTNAVLGGIAIYEDRTRTETLPNGKTQQYYGEDAGDAFFGTLGETIAGYIVPGTGTDQLINAAANLVGAVDEHNHRGEPAPNDGKARVTDVANLASDMTPSRMFAQTIGAGMRAYYDLGKAAGGQTSGVDKFADDAVRGKMGSVLQPVAMLADFVGNLGGADASQALNETLDKTEGTTLKKVGDSSGDAMYELGQSETAKEGWYGPHVQAASTFLGVSSDMIAGKSFEEAMDKNMEQAKGTLMGDAAAATWETGKDAVEGISNAKDSFIEWWNE